MIRFPKNTFGLSSLYIHIDMDAYAELSVYLADEFGSIKNSYRPFTGEIITSMIERKSIHTAVEEKYKVKSANDVLALAMKRYRNNSRMIHAIAFAFADQFSESPKEFRVSKETKEFITMLTEEYWDYYTVTALCRVARVNGNITRVYQEVMQKNCKSSSGILLLLTEFSDDIAFCSACSVFYSDILTCLEDADREYTIANNAMLSWFVKRCDEVNLDNNDLCISEQAKKMISDISMIVNDACTGSKAKKLEKCGFSKYAITYLNYNLHKSLNIKKEELIFVEYFRACIMYSTDMDPLRDMINTSRGKVINFGKLNGSSIDYFKNYIGVYNTFKEAYASFSLASFSFLCFSMTPERKKWISVLSEDDYLVNLNWNIEHKVPNIDLSKVNDLLESGFMSADAFSRMVDTGVIDLLGCDLDEENTRDLVAGYIAEFDTKMRYDMLFSIYEKRGIHFIVKKMPESMSRCLVDVNAYSRNIKVHLPLLADVDASYDNRILDIIVEFASIRYLAEFNDIVRQILDYAGDERVYSIVEYLRSAISDSCTSEDFKDCLLGEEGDEYEEDDEEDEYDE